MKYARPKRLITLASDFPGKQPGSLTAVGLNTLFFLLATCLPLLYWSPAYDAAGIPREMAIAVCAGVGVILFALLHSHTPAPISWHPVLLLITLFLCWAVASLYWSIDPRISSIDIVQLSALLIFTFLAAQLSCHTVQRFILPAAMVAAAIVALIGIGQHFDINPLSLRQSSPPASTFINKNYAANYLDLLVPIAFMMLLMQKRPASLMAFLATVSLATGLGFLFISQTRGSWLGLIVAFFGLSIACLLNTRLRQLLFRQVRLHQWALGIAFVFAVTLGFTDSRIIDAPEQSKMDLLLEMKSDSSIDARLNMYMNAMAGIADKPLLGVGYGGFTSGFSEYAAAVKPVKIISKKQIMTRLHSDPLQMFFELGLIGGTLFIAIYLAIIGLAWQVIKWTNEDAIRLTGLGLMLALLASGAHAWVDFPLRLPTSAFFFWFWSGLVIGLYLYTRPSTGVRLSRTTMIIAGITAALFTAHSTYLYSGYLTASTNILTAKLRAVKGDCQGAMTAIDHAMNDFGLDYFTRFSYVQFYTYCNTTSNQKLVAMDRILSIDRNMPLAYLTRANVQLADQYYQGAARDFYHYINLLPHQPEGYAGLAEIALQLDKPGKAREILEDGLKSAPQNKTLTRQLEKLKPSSQD